MASSRRSTLQQFSLVGTLFAGLVVGSPTARAAPPPTAFSAPVDLPAVPAPAPPPVAPLPPGYAPRALPLSAPLVQYPTYFYMPVAAGEPLPGTPTKRVWYGWQTLLVLGGSTTLGLVTSLSRFGTRADGLGLVGLSVGGAGLLFGGPIVHWAHGNTGKGFGALGLNFGVPLVGGGVGVGVACAAGGCSGNSGGFGVFFGLVIGGSLGLISSLVIDVTTLDYDSNVPVSAVASRKAPGWTLVPDLHITREKTTFGFAGVF